MASTGGPGIGGDYRFRLMYETLRSFLDRNNRTLRVLSDLEADLDHLHPSSEQIRGEVCAILEESLLMAQECNRLAGDRYDELYPVIFRIMAEVGNLFEEARAEGRGPLLVSLDDPNAQDPERVGGKAAAVAKVRRILGEAVPPGFVLTTEAYRRVLEHNRLQDRIRLLLKDLKVTVDRAWFQAACATIREWIRKGTIPEDVDAAIQEAAAPLRDAAPAGWAVRSSAIFEDGPHSFAGLFESELHVAPEGFHAAVLGVMAGRFLDRAVLYRLHRGIPEKDTPMAVLFMPMVEPAASGVIFTRDPADPEAETMLVSAVEGLGDRVVRGMVKADTFRLTRSPAPEIVEAIPASGEAGGGGFRPAYVSEETLRRVGEAAWRVREALGYDVDMEWAVEREGPIRFLQARRVVFHGRVERRRGGTRRELALVEGGITIFPGRAEGYVYRLAPGSDFAAVPPGSVVVVDQPGPELTPLLPRAAALLAAEGNPMGHLSTLAREFAVPSIFQLGRGVDRLEAGRMVSVDATVRAVYDGSRWPGIHERVLARIRGGGRPPRSGPLHDRILALNLTDPDAPGFEASKCRSLHDVLRFMHEMSVRAMFTFGDRERRGAARRSRRLETALPVRLFVIGLDAAAVPDKKRVAPEEVESIPFRAFWRGFADPRLPWPDRWRREMMGLSREFRETVLGGFKGPRRASDANYVMAAADYMNLNARFAYHYSMVDAVVGPGAENNHVYFSFRGGGGSDAHRALRARFLDRVLRRSRFEVDRRGDEVIAWLRRYPRETCEEMLERLGRLLVCSRELDATLRNEPAVRMYADYFLNEKYAAFA